jgi:hypothetical protein
MSAGAFRAGNGENTIWAWEEVIMLRVDRSRHTYHLDELCNTSLDQLNASQVPLSALDQPSQIYSVGLKVPLIRADVVVRTWVLVIGRRRRWSGAFAPSLSL